MKLLTCIVLCLLLCSTFAFQKDKTRKKLSTRHAQQHHKIGKLSMRTHEPDGTEANNGGNDEGPSPVVAEEQEDADKKLIEKMGENDWDTLKKATFELGKMFEATKECAEAADQVSENIERLDKLKSAGEFAIALSNINSGDEIDSKYNALKQFVDTAAEFVEIPGVHEFLQAYSIIMDSILKSINSWRESAKNADRQTTSIYHPGAWGGDLYETLNKACENQEITFSRSVKNWFISNAPLLKKITELSPLEFKKDSWEFTKNHLPATAMNEDVLRNWVKEFWPVAAWLAFGPTTENNRFCMCRGDQTARQGGCWDA